MSKQPSYVRCIKPNDFKRDGIFDENIISHQVKYLGLMENLRVRRAGFCYRRNLSFFLGRLECTRSVFPCNFHHPICSCVHVLYYACTYVQRTCVHAYECIFNCSLKNLILLSIYGICVHAYELSSYRSHLC